MTTDTKTMDRDSAKNLLDQLQKAIDAGFDIIQIVTKGQDTYVTDVNSNQEAKENGVKEGV